MNFGDPVSINFNFQDAILPTSVGLSVLEGVTGGDLEENSPWEPLRSAPKYSSSDYYSNTTFTLNTNSFTIFTLRLVLIDLLLPPLTVPSSRLG